MAEGLILQEQRTLTRRELIYYLKISDRRSGREIGRVGDIHAEGMLVLTDRPLPKGRIFEASLELPKAWEIAEGQKEMALNFETLWSRPGPKNSTYHESGTRFLDLDDSQRAIIAQVIVLFAMPGH